MTSDTTAALRYIADYLRAHYITIIATKSQTGSLWICSVYYAYIDGTLLFASRPSTRHARDIGEGQAVAFAVTDTNQDPTVSAHGVQATGIARPAVWSEYGAFVRYYALRFPKYALEMTSAESIAASLHSETSLHPYVLIPNKIKLVDKRFGENPVTLEG